VVQLNCFTLKTALKLLFCRQNMQSSNIVVGGSLKSTISRYLCRSISFLVADEPARVKEKFV
jgi:hypothetical protein